jgi:hypothetical protein
VNRATESHQLDFGGFSQRRDDREIVGDDVMAALPQAVAKAGDRRPPFKMRMSSCATKPDAARAMASF